MLLAYLFCHPNPQIADTFNQLDKNNKRLVIRGEVKSRNSMLAEAAHRAGITEQADYVAFQNAGYMELYGVCVFPIFMPEKTFLKIRRYWITWGVRN